MSRWANSLAAMLMTRVGSLGPTWYKERTCSHRLSSDLHMCDPTIWRKCKKSKSPFVLFSVRQNSTRHIESSDFGNENIITSLPSFHSVPPLLLLKFMDSFSLTVIFTHVCIGTHTYNILSLFRITCMYMISWLTNRLDNQLGGSSWGKDCFSCS